MLLAGAVALGALAALHWRIRTLVATRPPVLVGGGGRSRPRSCSRSAAARRPSSSPAARGCTTRRSSGASRGRWRVRADHRVHRRRRARPARRRVSLRHARVPVAGPVGLGAGRRARARVRWPAAASGRGRLAARRPGAESFTGRDAAGGWTGSARERATDGSRWLGRSCSRRRARAARGLRLDELVAVRHAVQRPVAQAGARRAEPAAPADARTRTAGPTSASGSRPTTLSSACRPDALGSEPALPVRHVPPVRARSSSATLPSTPSTGRRASPPRCPRSRCSARLGLWAVVPYSLRRAHARWPCSGSRSSAPRPVWRSCSPSRSSPTATSATGCPLLALGGLAGLQVLLRRREEPAAAARATVDAARRAAVLAGVRALGEHVARAHVPAALQPGAGRQRAGMLGLQYDVDGMLGGVARAGPLRHRPARPAGARPGPRSSWAIAPPCTGRTAGIGVPSKARRPAAGSGSRPARRFGDRGEWQPVCRLGPGRS